MAAPRDNTPASDTELRAAVLRVYQRLDLDRQVLELLGLMLDCTSATAGFAFAPGETLGALHPVQDSSRAAGAVPPARLERREAEKWIPGSPVVRFEDLGPLGDRLAEPPESAVVASVGVRLDDESAGVAGLVWLLFASEPAAEELERLGTLVELVRPAIANGLQVRAIRDLVIKDDTASCYNRRYFEEFLPEEMSRASRFRTPLSLIFFDLDNLKQVNNDHGHPMGSRTLFEVSARVRSKIRRFDRLFRFGGDEFCIVLPETQWHGALEVAERVRTSIASRAFLTEFVGEGRGLSMTASFGVASFPLHATDKESLVREADRAMQKVKGQSKDAVGVADSGGGDDGA